MSGAGTNSQAEWDVAGGKYQLVFFRPEFSSTVVLKRVTGKGLCFVGKIATLRTSSTSLEQMGSSLLCTTFTHTGYLMKATLQKEGSMEPTEPPLDPPLLGLRLHSNSFGCSHLCTYQCPSRNALYCAIALNHMRITVFPFHKHNMLVSLHHASVS